MQLGTPPYQARLAEGPPLPELGNGCKVLFPSATRGGAPNAKPSLAPAPTNAKRRTRFDPERGLYTFKTGFPWMGMAGGPPPNNSLGATYPRIAHLHGIHTYLGT